MCEHLSPQPIIIVSQAVAHGLRILKNFVSIHGYLAPGITRVPSYIHAHASLDCRYFFFSRLYDEPNRS